MEFLQVLADDCTFEGGYIPGEIVNLLSTLITIIKIVVPILLVVWGMLDLGKAVIAQKEDDIKKGQNTFFKRAIAAVIVFFIPAIVELIIDLIAGDDAENVLTCVREIF